MSNPTVILEDSNSEEYNKKSSSEEKKYTGTVVEGVDYQKASVNDERKIVGFFVSYSRKETGEYWPLYMGKNTIGSSAEYDIQLAETSVSREHGELVVRLLEEDEKEEARLVFILSDKNSSSGTKLNGVDLFKRNFVSEVKHGDIIRFGLRYKILLLCVDSAILGLNVDPKFQALGEEEPGSFEDYSQREPDQTRVFNK